MMKEELTTVQKLINTLIEFFVNYSFQVFGAVVILIIGFLVANTFQKILLRLFEQKKIDVTLAHFLAGIARLGVLSFAVLIALGKFGITIAPFVAALSALAFGASFAIQPPLSNFGAGLSIIFTRPFVVGDTISVAGQCGVVEKVSLGSTLLNTADGVKVNIPNRHIVGEILHNSHRSQLLEGTIGIAYDCDPEAAVRIIREVISQVADVTKPPEPQVGISQFADSSINIGYRYWVPTAKYFQTAGAVNLALYKALQAAGIKIPFPQREVRIVSQPTGV